MPELPEVTVYVDAIRERALGLTLSRLRLVSPFVLRSVTPTTQVVTGRTLESVRRLGKRIVLAFAGGGFLVLHLMVSGRLHWQASGPTLGGRGVRAILEFPTGSLVMTEFGSQHRATIHVAAGHDALLPFQRGGVDLFTITNSQFQEALRRQNRTVKRVLTDPDVVDGVGHTYSDEILHRARLSPFQETEAMNPDQFQTLLDSARIVLAEAIVKLRPELPGQFPTVPPANAALFAVHGRYGKPCPACGAPIQRIRYADHEANYCAACQTEGRLLRDRRLSRLLRDDWPRTLQDLEDRTPPRA